MTIEVYQPTSAADLLAHYLGVRKRFYGRKEKDKEIDALRRKIVSVCRQNKHLKATIVEAGTEIPSPIPGEPFEHINYISKVAEIIAICCEYGAVSRIDMMSVRRTKDQTQPRMIAMALACKLTRCSLPDIGRRFGGRDHTTVLNAKRKYAHVLSGINLSVDASVRSWVDATFEAVRAA